MPKIQVEKVVTFSSEDPNFPASNMLDPDPCKKWKCAKVGEKNAIIVLQLEKASLITNIDVGNEHSAFIEILASRSSAASDEFKPFLTMSTFMSPLEARQGQNVTKVRMFKTDDFSQPECNEKWDRLKIICTQPYNKHIQFGLSFIAIHSSENVDTTASKKNVGKFTLKPDSEDISIGSLFVKQKKMDNGMHGPLKVAAAIRDASNNPAATVYKSPIAPKPSKNTNGTFESPSSSNRNHDSLLYTQEDDVPNEKIDQLIEKKQKEDEEKKEKENKEQMKKAEEKLKKDQEKKKLNVANDGKNAKQMKRKSDDENETPKVSTKKLKIGNPSNKPSTSTSPDTPKRQKKERDTPNKRAKKNKAPVLRKEFSKLLEDVVFVISGIQNPDRANLRTAALSMGAKYKADWDRSCTHLICAFMNTPKFNQVKGRGKIVTKHWIVECHAQRARIPWRRYALDRNDKTGEESEEEVFEEVDNSDAENQSADSDTEDELDKIRATKKKPLRLKQLDSDSEELDEIPNGIVESDGLPTLPDYFGNKVFYLNPNLNELKKQLMQYIIAYNGTIVDEINDVNDETLVVTPHDKVDDLKGVLGDKKSPMISPVWIWECHNKKQLLSIDEYVFN